MKLIAKTKYLLARFVGFTLLILSANNVNAQRNSLVLNGSMMYGVVPLTISERIGIIINYAVGFLIILSIIIAPIVGYRWLFKKGNASYTKKLAGCYLKWILVLLIIFILLKGLVVYVISAIN